MIVSNVFQLAMLLSWILSQMTDARKDSHFSSSVEVRTIYPRFSQRETLGRNIFSLPVMMNHYAHFHLYLLYDKDHKDIVDDMTHFPEGFRSTTISAYQEKLTELEQSLKSVPGEIMVVVLCSPQRILTIFKTIQVTRIHSYFALWLLLLRDPKEEETLAQGVQERIREGTKVILMTEMSTETFRISVSQLDMSRGDYRFQETGIMELSTEYKRRRLFSFLKRDDKNLYLDMKGRMLRLAANNVVPFLIIGKGDKEDLGMEADIVRTLGKRLNFTFNIDVSIDGTWGDSKLDGTSTGVMGMVERGEADFALGHITITDTRSRAVDFTLPYYLDTLTILSKAPKIRIPTFAVFSPFDSDVWLAIIVITLSIGPILKMLSKMTELSLYQEPLGNLQKLTFNAFRSVVIQGNLISATFWSHRILFFSWYTFCLIISAIYSGTLVAVLTVPSYEKPVDSLRDLPKVISNGYTLGTGRGSLMYFLFKGAKEGIYRQTWNLFKHDDPSKSFVHGKDAYRMAGELKFVYISPTVRTYAEVQKLGKSSYYVARETFFTSWLGFGCPRGAPFREIFNDLILRMVEAGLPEKWKDDELRTMKKGKVEQKDSKERAIELIYLQAIFYTLGLGAALGTIAFIAEMISARIFDYNRI